jgi:DNA-binding MarR family transcriptional regulator
MHITQEQKKDLLHKVENALQIYFRLISMSTFTWNDKELTQLELQMLKRMDDLEHTTVTELAKITEVTKGGVSLFISKLAKKGLVSKTRDASNGSRVILSLTPDGQEFVEEFKRFHEKPNQFLTDYLKTLDDQEFSTVDTFTDKLTEWLTIFRDTLPESPKGSKYCRRQHPKNVPKT